MWQTPHGVTFLDAPMSSNSCSFQYKQPFAPSYTQLLAPHLLHFSYLYVIISDFHCGKRLWRTNNISNTQRTLRQGFSPDRPAATGFLTGQAKILFIITSDFYGCKQLIGRNNITSAPHPKVPTPHPGCSTTRENTILTQRLAILLIAIRGALLTTFAPVPRPHLAPKPNLPRNLAIITQHLALRHTLVPFWELYPPLRSMSLMFLLKNSPN